MVIIICHKLSWFWGARQLLFGVSHAVAVRWLEVEISLSLLLSCVCALAEKTPTAGAATAGLLVSLCGLSTQSLQ